MSTDMKELNNSVRGSKSADTSCLTKYDEYPSGSQIMFGFSFLMTLYFLGGKLYTIQSGMRWSVLVLLSPPIKTWNIADKSFE